MYINLPSDGGSVEFPSNSNARYTVNLGTEVNLDKGRWEVGLVSATYPHAFYNIPPRQITFFVNDEEPAELDFPGGYFETIQDLLYAINFEINKHYYSVMDWNFRSYKKVAEQFKFGFELDYTGKVVFKIKPTSVAVTRAYVSLGNDLLAKMGYVSNQPDAGTVADMYPDINAGLESIFVYCSIMRPNRVVGHQLLQVLRILPVTGHHGRMTFHEPTHVEYFPIAQNNFSEIHIELRDNLGRLFPFNTGKTNIELHFKKKSI